MTMVSHLWDNTVHFNLCQDEHMTSTPPLKHINVVGAVFTRHNKHGSTEVLAFRRGPNKDAAGLWEFAGGKIEPGESPEQALTREIDEELGIKVTVGELVLTTQTQVTDRLVTISCFHVVSPRMPTTSTDHDELRWVPLAQLHTLEWIAPDVPVVETLQASLPYS